MKKTTVLRVLAPIAGIVVLGIIVYQVGPASLWGNIQRLGWRLLPILSLSLVNYLLFTLAWRLCLQPEETPPRFGRLFRVKTIGEAVNASTPFNFAVGDPLRVYLLRGDVLWQGGTRSIVIDRTLYIAAVVTFILLGAILFFGHGIIPGRLLGPLLVSLAVLILALGGLAVLQRKGLFRFLLKVGDALRLTRRISALKREQLGEVDTLIKKTYRDHPGHLVAAFFAHFATRLVMIGETGLILHALNSPLPFGTVWALTAVVPLVNFTFNFLPGGLGVLEGVIGLIFLLLKFDPTIGVSLQLVRRIRSGCWVLLGWSLLLFSRGRPPRSG